MLLQTCIGHTCCTYDSYFVLSLQPDEHESANSDVSTGSHGTDLAVGAVRARRFQHGPQADADLASGQSVTHVWLV